MRVSSLNKTSYFVHLDVASKKPSVGPVPSDSLAPAKFLVRDFGLVNLFSHVLGSCNLSVYLLK